ncbi:metalloprotease family protein [Cytobacillus praedii]|uniref:metalloprotease family protein n=1 Tax=Cytobacillus praedii TaxID=1742358 RepID=UPI002E1BCD60|nr:metalloprotease family protein [Cytobacillus praedii]
MSTISRVNEIETPKWVSWLQYPMFIAFIAYVYFNVDKVLSSLNFSSELVVLYFIVLCLFIFITDIHEYCHYFTARLFRYKAKVYLKEKLCITYGEIQPVHFLMIAIAPAVFQGIIIISLMYYFSSGLILIVFLAVIYIASVTSDIYLASKSIRYLNNKSMYFKYAGDTERKAYFTINKTTNNT